MLQKITKFRLKIPLLLGTSGWVAPRCSEQKFVALAPLEAVVAKALTNGLDRVYTKLIKPDASSLCLQISVATTPGCNETAVTPVS